MLIVNTMCKLLFSMASGYFMKKKKVFNKEFDSKLSTFILQITFPCLIIGSVTRMGNLKNDTVYELLIIGVFLYAFLILLSLVLVRFMRLQKQDHGIYRCMFIFSNCAFMGIPVCQAFFGESAAFYVSILHLSYNVLIFSYGKNIIFAQDGVKTRFSIMQLMDPGIIASVIALVIFFFRIQLPSFILEPIYFVGDITTPLSMVVIGSSMAGYNLSSVFTDKMSYAVTFVKLLVIPFVVYWVLYLLRIDPLILKITTMTAAMPVGSLLVMILNEHEEKMKSASYSVVVSTICSIITIPIIAMLLGV